jgi:hypothetical protein
MRSRRTTTVFSIVAVLIAAFGATRAQAAPVIIERTLAFLNKKPVLLSEVELTKTLLQVDDEQALERTIDEALMFEEASRLLNGPPLEEDVTTAVTALKEKAGTGFSEAALKRKAQAQVSIANYIELRLRPLVRVEDAEVRRLFDEKAAKDQKAPEFDQVETAIRESLERRSLDRRIEEWVSSLRQRAEIRRPTAKRG